MLIPWPQSCFAFKKSIRRTSLKGFDNLSLGWSLGSYQLEGKADQQQRASRPVFKTTHLCNSLRHSIRICPLTTSTGPTSGSSVFSRDCHVQPSLFLPGTSLSLSLCIADWFTAHQDEMVSPGWSGIFQTSPNFVHLCYKIENTSMEEARCLPISQGAFALHRCGTGPVHPLPTGQTPDKSPASSLLKSWGVSQAEANLLY